MPASTGNMELKRFFHKASCAFLLLAAVLSPAYKAVAQFNTDRLLTSGKVALHYEDYVLSIQYFSQIIILKPHLYEPWQMRGIAKFYLDDYSGAESDATEAILLNPYIADIYDLRGICRIRQQNFEGAIDDYTKAIGCSPDNKNFWYNRVICRIENKD